MSEAQRNKAPITEETRKKLSAAQTGMKRPRTPEHAEKLRLANINRSILLAKYGFTKDEYEANRLAGLRWCYWRKHWVVEIEFADRMAVCRECRPEHTRMMNLRRLFGVDQSWYDAKLAEQGGLCAICDSPDPHNKGMRFLVVDHDHDSNDIRGLLCMKCNQALERVDHNPGWAGRALAYVRRYEADALAGLLPKAPKPFKKYVRPGRRKLQDYVAFRTGKKNEYATESEPGK